MSLKDARAELNRELGMRKAKYPAWIQSGLLSKEQAERQITRLEEVSKLLEAMTNREYETILARANNPATQTTQGNLFQ